MLVFYNLELVESGQLYRLIVFYSLYKYESGGARATLEIKGF